MNRSCAKNRLALIAGLTTLAALGACTNPVDRNAMIRYDLTPEMETLYERDQDVANHLAIMHNENWRMFWEDMGRFWYVDRPSRLTPEPMPH